MTRTTDTPGGTDKRVLELVSVEIIKTTSTIMTHFGVGMVQLNRCNMHLASFNGQATLEVQANCFGVSDMLLMEYLVC